MGRGFVMFVVVTPWAHFSPCVFVGRYRRLCVSSSPLLARTYIFEIDLCNLQHIRARRFHLPMFFRIEFAWSREIAVNSSTECIGLTAICFGESSLIFVML